MVMATVMGTAMEQKKEGTDTVITLSRAGEFLE